MIAHLRGCTPCRGAGRHLGVLVTASASEAGRLLDSASLPPGSRIWPLEGLAAADATAVQRRAAGQFAPGQVLLPLDLLGFAPRDRPALLRAFGSCVIAADDTGARHKKVPACLPACMPGVDYQPAISCCACLP